MGMENLAGLDTAEKRLNDIAMTGWQYSHDREMQDRQAEYNTQIAKDVNEHMAALNRHARLYGASDMVNGMKMAGLNPALADGSSFASTSSGGGSGVAAPSAAASRESSSMGKLAIDAIKYRESERDLMAAQSENLRADAAEKRSRIPGNEWGGKSAELMFHRSEAEDRSIAATLDNFYVEVMSDENLTNPVDKAIASTIESLSESEKVNKGSLDAIKQYLDFYGFNYQVIADNAENIVKRQYNQILMADKKYTKAEAEKILLENKKYIKDIAYLGSMMALASSEAELNEDQKGLISAQIDKVRQDIQSLRHSDVVWLAKNDKKGLGIKTAYDTAQATAAGLGFGLGAGSGGAVGKGIGNVIGGAKKSAEPQLKRVERTIRNFNKKGEETGSSHMKQLSY